MHKRRLLESCYVTGKNFLTSLGHVFELDHILNKTFLLDFMSKNTVNHFLIKIRYVLTLLNNLYLDHSANQTFKILKFRSPIVVHNLYNVSTRGKKTYFHNNFTTR